MWPSSRRHSLAAESSPTPASRLSIGAPHRRSSEAPAPAPPPQSQPLPQPQSQSRSAVDRDAAAALSPIFKAKLKHQSATTGGGGRSSAGRHTTFVFSEDRQGDADTGEAGGNSSPASAQQWQQQPYSPADGAPYTAVDNSPTALRRYAQYHDTDGNGPRMIPRSLLTSADAAAIAVDIFFAAPFLRLAGREATEREVAARLRGYVKRLTSRLHEVRVAGLKGAIGLLLQWTTQAAVESAERQQQQHQASAAGNGLQTGGMATLSPYDAVGIEVLGTPPAAGLYGHGAAANRAEASARALARRVSAVRSPTWDVVQVSLEGVDYTSAIFNAILVPRLEVRNAMSTGMPINIQLTSDMALKWTTRPTMRAPVAAAALASEAAVTSSPSTGATPPKLNALLEAATAVTYEEQELALRYIHGACLGLYYQRQCCSEGCLLYYATEVFQCLRSHVDAVFTLQRREMEEQGGGGGVLQQQRQSKQQQSSVQVPIDTAQLRVVVALIDAVEAACHYNPSSLRRLVQTGGVNAMLNLAYCPFMPTAIRSAVLNTISVLMQEVGPLRRYVAAARKPATEGGIRTITNNTITTMNAASADPLLRRMVLNALHDNPMGQCGKQIPYATDRGSASKFDSAVRDWFIANGLGNVLAAVVQLQDLRSTFQPSSFAVPSNYVLGAVGGGGGIVGGSGVLGQTQGPGSAVAGLPPLPSLALTAAVMAGGGGSSGAGVGGLQGGPLTGRSYVGGGVSVGAGAGGPTAGGGPGAGGAAVGGGAATHLNLHREGELHRKRIGRLLECMDGRELR